MYGNPYRHGTPKTVIKVKVMLIWAQERGRGLQIQKGERQFSKKVRGMFGKQRYPVKQVSFSGKEESLLTAFFLVQACI